MSELEQVKEETSLPPGYRFHPTDEELVVYYLMNKISDANFKTRAITDVDLNKCEPWDLPGKAKMGKKEWYFFNQRDRKYPTGVRTNRATNTGYWKTTGKDKEIFNSNTSEHIGMKKTLVFYRGRAPRGEKMNWVMHEYRIYSRSTIRINKQQDDAWVVCRVFQKSACGKKHPTTISNHHQQYTSTRSMANTYNLQMAQANVAMPVPDHQPWHSFSMGRNYTVAMGNNTNNGEILENISSSRTTSNLAKGSNIMVVDNMTNCHPTTLTTMVPGPYHDGWFTMSSLKLNASGGSSAGSSAASGQANANIFRQSHLHDQDAIAATLFGGGGMVDGLHAPNSSGGTNQFMEDFIMYNYPPPPY